jgi:hypothetical protein
MEINAGLSEPDCERYAVPVICLTDGCPQRGNLIHVISGIAEDNLDLFFEGFADDCPEDYCPECRQLGVACDPVAETLLTRLHKGSVWSGLHAGNAELER